MSKKQMMPMPTGSGLLPKLISTAVVLALLAMVVEHPHATADWLQGLFAWATGVVDGMSAFFQGLTA